MLAAPVFTLQSCTGATGAALERCAAFDLSLTLRIFPRACGKLSFDLRLASRSLKQPISRAWIVPGQPSAKCWTALAAALSAARRVSGSASCGPLRPQQRRSQKLVTASLAKRPLVMWCEAARDGSIKHILGNHRFACLVALLCNWPMTLRRDTWLGHFSS